MKRVNIFHTLARYPILYFEIRDYRGTGTLGNRYTVPHMIAMSMGYEDKVGLNLIGFERSDRHVRYTP